MSALTSWIWLSEASSLVSVGERAEAGISANTRRRAGHGTGEGERPGEARLSAPAPGCRPQPSRRAGVGTSERKGERTRRRASAKARRARLQMRHRSAASQPDWRTPTHHGTDKIDKISNIQPAFGRVANIRLDKRRDTMAASHPARNQARKNLGVPNHLRLVWAKVFRKYKKRERLLGFTTLHDTRRYTIPRCLGP